MHQYASMMQQSLHYTLTSPLWNAAITALHTDFTFVECSAAITALHADFTFVEIQMAYSMHDGKMQEI